MNNIYFDNAATTEPLKSVIEKMKEIMELNFANPSSIHGLGIQAMEVIENSRKFILDFINSSNGNIIFTSGGTESNNLAIIGSTSSILKSQKIKIITTKIEHDSVLNAVKKLQLDGAIINLLDVDVEAKLNIDDINNNIDINTVLISVMLVNNELGTIEPIKKIKEIIRNSNFPNKILLHVDAVQGFGKIPIDVTDLDVDFLSVSSHKIHGPKGIGFLYIKNNIKINPIMFGGGQEKNIRPGTEPSELIAAFEKAIRKCNLDEDYKYVKKINIYIRQKLKELKEIHINSPEDASPYIINFSVIGIKSESIFNFLSSKGIYTSFASACTKNKKSHVLKAMNLPNYLIDSAIRVSFSKFNTIDEVDILISEIKNAIKYFMY